MGQALSTWSALALNFLRLDKRVKTLKITLTPQQYDIACLRLIDPELHLQNWAETMQHIAMQELGYQQLAGGGYDAEDIKAALAKPSAKSRNEKAKAVAETQQILAEQKNENLAKQKAKDQAEAELLEQKQALAAQNAETAKVEARAVVLARAMMQTLAPSADPRPTLEAAAAMMAKPQAKAGA